MPYIKVPKLSGSHPLVLDTAVQVKLKWQLNDVPCVNILGGRVAGGFVNSPAHAADLALAVQTAFTDSGLGARLASTTVFQGVGIRDLRVANQVEYPNNTFSATGTGTAEPLPNQLAACITLRTDLAGKSYRGRVYISGADEDQNTATGTIDNAFNTAAVAFLEGVKDAMSDEGITLAVLSFKRYLNLPPPADLESWGGAVNDVTSIEARDTEWDTQRRRKH